MKIKPSLWKQESGAGLVDALVALALLGLVGVAFLAALNTGSRAVRVIDEQISGDNLARAELEAIKNASYPISDYQDSQGEYVICVDANPDPPAEAKIQQITVTIKRGEKVLTEVIDFKVDR